jgi:hypothetical protein
LEIWKKRTQVEELGENERTILKDILKRLL